MPWERRQLPIGRRGVVLSSVAFLSVAGALTAGLLLRRAPPLPEIAATLEGDESQFSRRLTDRLRDKFPTGSSQTALLDFLEREGFSLEPRQEGDENSSVFVRAGALCRKTVRVRWRADFRGAIADINGEFEGKCF